MINGTTPRVLVKPPPDLFDGDKDSFEKFMLLDGDAVGENPCII
jgi:hypothetical protein